VHRRRAGARNYLIGGGVIYAVLWLYGLLIGDSVPANLVAVNIADDLERGRLLDTVRSVPLR
jgi:hypothetical protein